MQNKPQSDKDLNVWKKGIDLAKLIYHSQPNSLKRNASASYLK